MNTDRPAVRLAELLENAPRVPLLRNRVRVDKVQALQLVDAIADEAGSPADASSATSDLLATVASVRDAVRTAYPIPLTDQVRLPAERATGLAAELRSRSDP